MIDDEGERYEQEPVVKKDTSHAPDLLEGPSIDHNREKIRCYLHVL